MAPILSKENYPPGTLATKVGFTSWVRSCDHRWRRMISTPPLMTFFRSFSPLTFIVSVTWPTVTAWLSWSINYIAVLFLRRWMRPGSEFCRMFCGFVFTCCTHWNKHHRGEEASSQAGFFLDVCIWTPVTAAARTMLKTSCHPAKSKSPDLCYSVCIVCLMGTVKCLTCSQIFTDQIFQQVPGQSRTQHSAACCVFMAWTSSMQFGFCRLDAINLLFQAFMVLHSGCLHKKWQKILCEIEVQTPANSLLLDCLFSEITTERKKHSLTVWT